MPEAEVQAQAPQPPAATPQASNAPAPAPAGSGPNPGPIKRRVASFVARAYGSPLRRRVHFGALEIARRARRRPRVLHYFHEVADPYSHLAAQALPALLRRYAITLRAHVAPPNGGAAFPEPLLLYEYARRDAAAVAPHYGLRFPPQAMAPLAKTAAQAEALLAAATATDDFAPLAGAVGEALWAGDAGVLPEGRTLSTHQADAHLAAAALRRRMGHYAGAMFHYQGEWFWGVDRLHHLEARLIQEGAARESGEELLFPRPPLALPENPAGQTQPQAAADLTLEYFPSLRSPYTAIAHPQVLRLARAHNLKLHVRPVLPMVMRGVPVTRAKGMYIFADARREALHAGIPFGAIHDPVGSPVANGYALWHWAEAQGRGNQLLGAFLSAAFAEGVAVSTRAGLRRVVRRAGLNWNQAAEILANVRSTAAEAPWRALLEKNRLHMYNQLGLWGVPSFRLTNVKSGAEYACWGNDRLWLLARKVQEFRAALQN